MFTKYFTWNKPPSIPLPRSWRQSNSYSLGLDPWSWAQFHPRHLVWRTTAVESPDPLASRTQQQYREGLGSRSCWEHNSCNNSSRWAHNSCSSIGMDAQDESPAQVHTSAHVEWLIRDGMKCGLGKDHQIKLYKFERQLTDFEFR